MFYVYVVKAKDLPSESGECGEPFVELFGKVNQTLFHFGTTQCTNKTINPVFDADFANPFLISFTRIETLHLEIFDHGSITSTGFLGFVDIPLNEETIGLCKTYKIMADFTDRNPEIEVKIEYHRNVLKEGNFNPQLHQHVTTFLTYNPPLKDDEEVDLRFYSYDKETGTVLHLPGSGTVLESFLKVGIAPLHHGPSGLTNVAYVYANDQKEKKVNSKLNYLLPVCSVKNYRGIITLNVCAAHELKEKKFTKSKAYEDDVHLEQKQIILFKQIPLLVASDIYSEDDEDNNKKSMRHKTFSYSFGVILDFSVPKRVTVDSITIPIQLQEKMQFLQNIAATDQLKKYSGYLLQRTKESGKEENKEEIEKELDKSRQGAVRQIIQLILGSPFCMFSGLEHVLIEEIMKVVQYNAVNYNNVLELVKTLIIRSTGFSALRFFKGLFLNYLFSTGKEQTNIFHKLIPKLAFARDLVDSQSLGIDEVLERIMKLNTSQKNFFFYYFIYFAPELEEKHPQYFNEKLNELNEYYSSRRTDTEIRTFLKQIDNFRAKNWALLKEHIKYGGSRLSTGTDSLQYSIRTKDINLFKQLLSSIKNTDKLYLELSVLDPIRSISDTAHICAYCCYYNAPECLKLAIEKNASLENLNTHTIADFAVRSGNNQILEILKESGALKETAIETSLAYSNISAYNWLISNIKNAKKRNKGEFAKYCISNGNLIHFSLFRSDLEKNPDLNACFIDAVKNGHISSAKLLLSDYNCDPNFVGADAAIPFQISINNGDVGMASLLLSYQVPTSSLGDDNSIPILTAITFNNIDLVKRICSSPTFDPNFNAGQQNRTPLFVAVQNGNTDMVETLLNCAVVKQRPELYLNYKNENGENAIFIACRENHYEIAKLLIENGSSTTITNKDGKTAQEITTNPEIKALFDDENGA